ncbi:hypothetical protein H0H81_002781 [Sphagnurus paluster]|uniref:Uncharacterized protein n=1 Tax=Sphagnurus paluster TaxID=117069 RepID=A0A9P7FVF7_9AGAR|nr:hypothetical protein H0H81_002781 [Sphagnurus paluster]
MTDNLEQRSSIDHGSNNLIGRSEDVGVEDPLRDEDARRNEALRVTLLQQMHDILSQHDSSVNPEPPRSLFAGSVADGLPRGWYPPVDDPLHSGYRTQSEIQPTVVQFPHEVLDPAVELVQDIRLGQRAVAEQQHEFTQSMQIINDQLERMVEQRNVRVNEMCAQLESLRTDIGRMYRGTHC